jgi:hypothetical protein
VDVGRGGSRPRLLPLLIGALALVNAPTSARQLLLSRRAQWVRVHELPAAGCANDYNPSEAPRLMSRWTCSPMVGLRSGLGDRESLAHHACGGCLYRQRRSDRATVGAGRTRAHRSTVGGAGAVARAEEVHCFLPASSCATVTAGLARPRADTEAPAELQARSVVTRHQAVFVPGSRRDRAGRHRELTVAPPGPRRRSGA